MNRLALVWKRLRRALLRRRRLLAALAGGTAVAAGLQANAGPPAPTSLVVAGGHDLPAGAVLDPADLAPVEFAPDSVPAGVLGSAAEAVGRTTATPVRSGEPITDVRLVAGSLLAGYPGMVAAPVRIGDPAAVSLLQIGDRVDVLAADPNSAGDASVVAEDAAVIALPRRTATGSSMVTGGLVVLAVTDATAVSLAEAGVSRFLSITINP